MVQDQRKAFLCNPGVLQIFCNLVAAFHHCLTSIYCIKRNGAINYGPASAIVYFCQALSAGLCFVKYRFPLSPVYSPQSKVWCLACPWLWVGGVEVEGGGVLPGCSVVWDVGSEINRDRVLAARGVLCVCSGLRRGN